MFPVGSFIQVIGYLDKRKLKAKVLGWGEGEYILISVPTFNGEEANLPKDAALVCRGMMDGRMYGFKTIVLHQMTQPFNYLFLNYPPEMEDLSGSKGYRLGIEISAMAVLGSQEMDAPPATAKSVEASVQNLSNNGCVVTVPSDVQSGSFDAVFLSFDLPNNTSVKNLKGNLRKDVSSPEGGSFGVEFTDGDPNFAPVFDFLLLANKITTMND